MEVLFKFNPDDENNDDQLKLDTMLASENLACRIREVDNELRGLIKHGDEKNPKYRGEDVGDVFDFADEIRKHLRENFGSYGFLF